MSNEERRATRLLIALVVAMVTARAGALVVPEPTAVSARAMRRPDLDPAVVYQPVSRLPAGVRAQVELDLAALDVPADGAFVDPRSGRFGTLLPAAPLLPGDGIGNLLRWSDLGDDPPTDEASLREAVWSAFTGYLRDRRVQLGIDPAELTRPGHVTVLDGGELIQVVAPRVVGGVPVRDSYLTAVIRHGNLVLFGAVRWGDVHTSTEPTVFAEEAMQTLQTYLGAIDVEGSWRKAHLNLLPVSAGTGYGYRLAWVLSPVFAASGGDLGRWEALVDAHTGDLLALEDTNRYASTRRVQGGVYPAANDGIPPDGVEQAGWPMPFSDLVTGPDTRFADTGGNLDRCVDGTVTTHLDGAFVQIADQCGAIDESTAGDVLDLGTGAGTDCTAPAGHSAGDTHAARTGFYELNRIAEQARAQLPANGWLGGRLTANMNLPLSCNAFWDGVSVNFYRSSGSCRNTGEVAGIFDHEWGHGLDDNGANPSLSNPGEGIADVYAALRLDTSCIGRGFLQSGACGGYGDPCTMASGCSGVRDIDYAHRVSGTPHDVTWIDANCNACGTGGPCGGCEHCEGAVYAEAVWDLFHRDLTAGAFNYDANRALELATLLTYRGAGPVGQWFQCSQGSGGCNADGGYLNYLAVDDDNGNLADGTPHMTALFAAFDRHGIACATPTVQNSGCTGAPTVAPSVTAAPRDRGVHLSWGAVAGASRYAVYRGEGVAMCAVGKVRVGETTGLSFDDEGLQNGRAYSYTVAAVGASDVCSGPMSACTAATPIAGASLLIETGSAAVIPHTGDGDAFLDNCEAARLTFDVTNNGTGTQTNVRIVGVAPLSHPATVVTTGFPSPVAASLAACATATGGFDLVAHGLAFDDTLELRVDLTSDQLGGAIESAVLRIAATESDLQHFAARTFDFEAGLDGWSVLAGSFSRQGGGGGAGTTFALHSSTLLDDQCDRVRSPLLKLAATSTLSLWNNYQIEPMSSGTWYDRANVGIVRTSDGSRTIVSPNGGRLYNAATGGPGTFTGCNDGQPGWADSNATWGTSSWSAAALMAPAFAGQLVRLEATYSTDAALALAGFAFDQVTVTDVDVQVPDAQSEDCALIFADGFESGDASAWSAVVP